MSTTPANHRCTPEQRARIATEVQKRRAAGQTWKSITHDLGISYPTLRVWCNSLGEPAFLPVAVSHPAALPSAVNLISQSHLVLVTPAGYRVENASLDEIIELLGALAC